MSKLDDVLSWQQAPDLHASEKRDAKEQIKVLMLELVDKDREYGPNDLPEVIEQIKTENRVNAELRTKIQAL